MLLSREASLSLPFQLLCVFICIFEAKFRKHRFIFPGAVSF